MQFGLWAVAAVGALLLGLTAVGSIGTGLAGGPQTAPLSAAEIETRLARHAAGTPAAVTATPAPAPSGTGTPPAPAPPVVVRAAAAGTVLARCEGTTPRIVSVNPAQGFEREDDDVRPGQVLFDGDDADVLVTLSCADGTPSGQVVTRPED